MEKGMLFFYDWIEPFSMLEAKEFKKLLLAMLEYDKNGTEPPEMEGASNFVAMFVFPQLKRLKEAVANGKKGGRPKKSNSPMDIAANPSEDYSDFDEIIARQNARKNKTPESEAKQ